MTGSIGVMNCSGNVGKTTITRQLLAPRLPGHSVAMIESINADEMSDAEVEVLLAREASSIHERMLQGEQLVVDIGASNVEEYLQWLQAAQGAQQDYALFVIPVVPAKKQMQDTIKTIDMLADLGVEPERIRLVFNMFVEVLKEPLERTLRREFAPIFDYHARDEAFTLRLEVAVPESSVFSMSAEVGLTVFDISREKTDYRALIANEPPGEGRNRLVKVEGLRRLAVGMEPRLDAAFRALVLEESVT